MRCPEAPPFAHQYMGWSPPAMGHIKGGIGRLEPPTGPPTLNRGAQASNSPTSLLHLPWTTSPPYLIRPWPTLRSRPPHSHPGPSVPLPTPLPASSWGLPDSCCPSLRNPDGGSALRPHSPRPYPPPSPLFDCPAGCPLLGRQRGPLKGPNFHPHSASQLAGPPQDTRGDT